MAKIEWNKNLKLILSDVDETVADLYTAATPEMCRELEDILAQGTVIFFITGQNVKSIRWRITDQIEPKFRNRILMGHCSGAEVWGFDSRGDLNTKPFYSLYENSLTEEQKSKWREIARETISYFKLVAYPAMPIAEFKVQAGDDPLAIMLEDRGPQITLEVVNGHNLTPEQVKSLAMKAPWAKGNPDLRIPIIERLDRVFQQNNLPLTPRLAGVFAIDLALRGVSKTTAIKYILDNDQILKLLGIDRSTLKPENMEVWGDKFSVLKGGTDRHISEALPKEVRSITFRQENPSEFLEGYNIVVWDGQKHLQDGLLEFLKTRPAGPSMGVELP